nr:hypothetical protein BACY1_10630 [Tenacibaculum mesophilum]
MEQKKRVLAIDMARGISVLSMIPVHSMIIYSTMDTWNNSFLGKVAQVLEKGTPMFLVVMGFSFVFSSKLSMFKIFKRGINILAKGYLLNILRFAVPMLLFGGFPRAFIEGNGLTLGDSYNYLFFILLGDILQLVGISLIIMGVIIKFIKNKYAALTLALLIVFFTGELSGYKPNIVGVDYICDLLWGKTYNVYFPVFPWMSFILIGLFFGMWYQESNNNIVLTYKRMLVSGVLFMCIGVVLCYYNYEYHFGDYYHLGPGGTIAFIGVNLFLVWFGHILVTCIPHNKLYDVIYYSSKNVTTFYLVQWVLIYWGVLFFGYSSQTSQLKLLAIIIGITLLTFGVLWTKKRAIKLIAKQKQSSSTKRVKQAIT